mmetsp:Transcript_4038/g.10326  ORF Transcript_4038/g.10326 Transcript_4038/m.10326 type:complete len:80 (+) Transcript_4038:1934-2173(+)
MVASAIGQIRNCQSTGVSLPYIIVMRLLSHPFTSRTRIKITWHLCVSVIEMMPAVMMLLGSRGIIMKFAVPHSLWARSA